MAHSATAITRDGNTWFYKQQGTGPHLVLIPSGEGDCAYFDPLLAQLSHVFTVTTFDMPGMSRSVPVAASAVTNVTGKLLADLVVALLDHLDIKFATFWGCSSGGATVLHLAALYPERVRNALVHEVPMADIMPQIAQLMAAATQSSDRYGPGALDDMEKRLVGHPERWNALGEAYRGRVLKNLPVWHEGYAPGIPNSVSELVADEANLKRRPIDWTLGGFTPLGFFFANAKVAHAVGIPLSLLPCLHFPQISIPEMLGDHIEKTTRKYL